MRIGAQESRVYDARRERNRSPADGVKTPAAPAVRVLIVHPRDLAAPTIGGIQTFLHDFVKFAPHDFEITFAGVTHDPKARPIGRRALLDVDGHKAWFLPLAAVGRVPRHPLRLLEVLIAQVRLRRQMLSANAILQVHRPYRWFFLAGHRGPRVQFVHVDIQEWPGPVAWSRARGLYREFSDRTLEQMARVFVVNEAGVLSLREEHPRIAERIEFLPVWFDNAVFHPAKGQQREELRQGLLSRLGVGAAAKPQELILFAARLDPIKDPELAVDGFAELLRSHHREARLLIAGNGLLRDAIDKQAERLGIVDRVHFLGDRPREEIADLMRAVDALLLTSVAEGGGPRVVVEALASGVPVVAPVVGEVARTVAHQKNGWLLGERTAAEVARGLAWVLDQPRAAIAEEAMQAARPYPAQAVLAGLYETYRSLAAGKEPDGHRW